MLKKIFVGFYVLVLLLVGGALVMGWVWQSPGEEATPAGMPRNSSYYIDMPDGARIAVDLWLPADLEAGQRVPTVIEGTRYWRGMGLTFLGRIAAAIGMSLPAVHPSNYNKYFPGKGYAMLTVDIRGTGASSGVHTTEYSVEEKEDYRHIIEWVAQQEWSSGDVFAVGVSYSGTSAELMTTSHHPALKAVAPLYSDFDAQMQLVLPGGVYQPAFVETWSKLVAAMDQNDLCGVLTASNTQHEPPDCDGIGLLISGVKPVDGQENFLAEAVATHDSPNVEEMVRKLEYRDSAWGRTEVTPLENLPFGMQASIEGSKVPMFVVTGWFDAATTNGALARFATFTNPQEVWVGALSHGGGQDTDPYQPTDTSPVWSQEQQLDKVHRFFERYRTDREGEPLVRNVVNYYVNGAAEFKQTDTWPPTHLSARKFYLTKDGRLDAELPRDRGFNRYQVSRDTATATSSRWLTQLGGSDVIYDRRAEMAARTLNFTTGALEQDSELTGSVVLDLWMTSDQAEGALHAYLEDLAPDGTVRYLTEGVLNLVHRENTDTPHYPVFGPSHSFLRDDAQPIPTKQLVSFSMTLYATSALIKQGHRLRLSIAGADAASFGFLPDSDPMPKWHIYSGPTSPSSITVWMSEW